MLTCYAHKVRLPQNDLVYLAFRLAVKETLSDIELHLDLEEDPDPPVGYLNFGEPLHYPRFKCSALQGKQMGVANFEALAPLAARHLSHLPGLRGAERRFGYR